MLLFKFSTEEEVIKYANDSAYGLSASVFTTDPKKAERVAAQVRDSFTWIKRGRYIFFFFFDVLSD